MLPMCQNTTMWVSGAWIKRYCILCYKTFNTLHTVVITSLRVHDMPLGASASVKRVYCDHQQCSLSLVVRSETINLSLGHDTKPVSKQYNIKANLNLKSKLALKLYDENIRHVNITIPSLMNSVPYAL